jgi:NTP pyrophosphatase (non-canonical NTP hydrolase)
MGEMSREWLVSLRDQLREFATARDWEQFHTPKNLAMALAGEVGEVLELFQWLTADEAASVMATPRGPDVRDEIADVLIYLVRLADVLDIDLDEAVRNKITANSQRYPIDRARGSAAKYTQMRDE